MCVLLICFVEFSFPFFSCSNILFVLVLFVCGCLFSLFVLVCFACLCCLCFFCVRDLCLSFCFCLLWCLSFCVCLFVFFVCPFLLLHLVHLFVYIML